MTFVRFMKSHKCYEIIPTSAKLVVFDVQLLVSIYKDMGKERGGSTFILVWVCGPKGQR